MKKFLAALLALPALAWGQFSYMTFNGTFTNQYPSSDHKDFEWNWNGYSDTKLNTAFLYQFTNVHFRLSWPKDGTVFLDITDGTLTTTNYNVIIPRTNFPPNGPYYAEFLGDSEGLNRILAAGRVNIQHSIWQNTDQSTWTNPVGGMVIGPPFHTISTPYTNWPFVSEVVVNEVDGASSGSITSGTLIINVSTNHAINLATNTLNAHYVNIDGDTMTGKLHMGADLNMAGFSVTNIASSSIGFADGTSFGSANVILWNSVTNSGAGTITNIVAGTGLTGGGTNSSVTIDVDTNSIAERAWATAQFVDAAGDSMSGNLDMGNNNITNINDVKDNSNLLAIDVGGRVIYYTDGVAKVVNASSLTLAGAAGGVWKLAAGDSPSAAQDIVDVGWVQGQSYLTSESDIGVTNLVAGDDILLDGTREVTINADTNSLAQRGWVLAQNLNAAYTEWFTPTDFDASTNLTITHNLGERVVAQLRDESSNQVYITSQLFNDSVVWNMTPYASMTGFAVVVADTNAINVSAFADKKTSAVITSSPYTAGTADWLYIDDDTVGAAVTVNLPAAASNSEQVYYIKKMGTTGDITIDGDGAETIDGSTTITLTLQYESVILHTTGSSVAGSHWHIH